MDLKEIVEKIIDEIPNGYIFDAHTVSRMCIEKYSDDYLRNHANTDTKTNQFHGNISNVIRGLEKTKVEQIGKGYSMNIHNNLSECTFWRKKAD